MNKEQQHILRHALGLNSAERAYRNHFVTGPGSDDYANCEALVAAGFMTRRDGDQLKGDDPIYTVTSEGRTAINTESAEQRKV